MNAQTLLLALVIGVIVVILIWYLTKQVRDDFESAVDEIESSSDGVGSDSSRSDAPSHTKGGTRIPISSRAKALSLTGKVMFGSIGLLVVILGIFAFQTLRTGSPSEVMFTDQIVTGLKVLVGVVVGIIGKNMVEKHEGEIINLYETDSGDIRKETIPVDLRGVESDSKGQPVVKELAKRRVLGLFRRSKHVAEDAKLEGTHRAPGKPIEHQIADHAVEVGDGTFIQRTEKQNETKDPNRRPDYVYSAPVELSYDMYLSMKESKRRMTQELSALESTVAVLENELDKLTQMLKNGQYKEEQELLEKIDRIAEIVQVQDQESNAHSTPRDTHVSLESNNGHQPPGDASARADGGTNQ